MERNRDDRKRRALSRACDIVGGQGVLARKIGVNSSHVWNWINRDQAIPGEYCLRISIATDDKVLPRDMRPDLFGMPNIRVMARQLGLIK